MNRTRYWWPTATTEQKLHQVKHAIEARLTCGETGTLLGTYGEVIAGFASRHGLSFANSDRSFSNRRRAAANKNAEAARVASWRLKGMEETDIFDRIDYRRTNDDDVRELRFTE